jgi:hypothetical protein
MTSAFEEWDWEAVERRYRSLEQYVFARPIVAAMLRLVTALRDDPRLTEVVPVVSHFMLTFRSTSGGRYVAVWCSDDKPRGYEVSFVDPPLELRQIKYVSDEHAAAAVIEYVDQLRH